MSHVPYLVKGKSLSSLQVKMGMYISPTRHLARTFNFARPESEHPLTQDNETRHPAVISEHYKHLLLLCYFNFVRLLILVLLDLERVDADNAAFDDLIDVVFRALRNAHLIESILPSEMRVGSG